MGSASTSQSGGLHIILWEGDCHVSINDTVAVTANYISRLVMTDAKEL